jgi:hypothetical protein
MSCKNNTRSGTKSGFNYTNDVGHAQTCEQGPQKKVLKSSWTGGEIVYQRVIFHIDSDKIIETGSGKVENSRNFLSVEKIGCLIPVLLVSLAVDGNTIHIALR